MRKVAGLVIAVGITVLLGTHLEVAKTLAYSQQTIAVTPLPPVQPATPTVSAAAASSTSIEPSTEVPAALDARHVTTTPEIIATAAVEIVQPASTASEEPAPAFKADVSPKQPTIGTADQYPKRLIIPSIGLNVPIVPVGVNAKGEMDVPSGSSDNVGWYKGGPMPGSYGSAVLDAHVFAALKDLRYVKVGDPVYVLTQGGTRLRFTVKESTVFTLSEITSSILFGRSGGQWLNIITCAGTYIPSLGTYDHRLVDFALFEAEELE